MQTPINQKHTKLQPAAKLTNFKATLELVILKTPTKPSRPPHGSFSSNAWSNTSSESASPIVRTRTPRHSLHTLTNGASFLFNKNAMGKMDESLIKRIYFLFLLYKQNRKRAPNDEGAPPSSKCTLPTLTEGCHRTPSYITFMSFP